MKRILLLILAALWMAAPSGAFAQSVTRLCFPTNLTASGGRTSCQVVDANNPLPSSATISLGSSINVTPNNLASAPLFVTNPNGFGGGTTSGSVFSTITNTTSGPVFVSSPNGFGGGTVSGGPFNVTITNTVPLNVSETNSAAILNAINAAIPAGTNAIGTVTVQNSNANNPVYVQQTPGTSGGWTPLLLNGLSTTVTTVKNTAGKLAKLYCYNPNSSVAYVQVFNITPSSVTLGTTTPLNSYGIGQTSIGGFGSSVGDNYSTAISIAATTTVKGLTAPSTALDCNVSYN